MRGASRRHGREEVASEYLVEAEEDRMRRKRAKREAKRIAKELQAKEGRVAHDENDGMAVGYTDEDNPFGDRKLSERFVWGKKIEKKILEGATREELGAEAERKKHRARMEEVEKVKREREEREKMREQMEEEKQKMNRERAWKESVELEKKEEKFLLEQARIRSHMRQMAGRAKAIDIFARMLHAPEKEDVDMPEPHQIVDSLDENERKELVEHVLEHKELDREDETCIQFWNSLLVLCDHAMRSQSTQGSAAKNTLSRRMNLEIEKDVQRMFAGKSGRELEELQRDIQDMMQSGKTTEYDYWEEVLDRIKVKQAKVKLQDILKLVQSLPKKEEPSRPFQKFAHVAPPRKREAEEDIEERNAAYAHHRMHDSGGQYSRGMEAGSIGIPSATQPRSNDPEEEFRRSALGAMGMAAEGEEVGAGFNEEVELAGQKYAWQDKYRPRKPKYFNRVHTGYDWNKYNRTHYDHDNPPPKTIQGYKFNIFYPDLIERDRTPTYKVEPDPSNSDGDTCILRFHAGPPYEDIAFRIVNKDWEYSRKRGFKSVFDRGVLQLYFNLKRARYRR